MKSPTRPLLLGFLDYPKYKKLIGNIVDRVGQAFLLTVALFFKIVKNRL